MIGLQCSRYYKFTVESVNEIILGTHAYSVMTAFCLSHRVCRLSVWLSVCRASDLENENCTRYARNFVTLQEIGVGEQEYDVGF